MIGPGSEASATAASSAISNSDASLSFYPTRHGRVAAPLLTRCASPTSSRLIGLSPARALLRRAELLPSAAVRPLVDDALASAAGRGALGRLAPGEPVGGAQDGRAGDP